MATSPPRCESCHRKIDTRDPRADHLFNRPDETEVWLCGKPKCYDKYNGTEPEDHHDARAADSPGARSSS